MKSKVKGLKPAGSNKKKEQYDYKWATEWAKRVALQEAQEAYQRSLGEFNFVYAKADAVLAEQNLRIATTIEKVRPTTIKSFLTLMNVDYPSRRFCLESNRVMAVSKFKIDWRIRSSLSLSSWRKTRLEVIVTAKRGRVCTEWPFGRVARVIHFTAEQSG